MYRKPLTETDIIQANRKFICAVADHYRSIEKDDRRSIAAMGFFIAVRTYQKTLVKFHPYALEVMNYYLAQERLRQNRAKRAESRLSLDQSIGSKETIGSYYMAQPQYNDEF